MTISTNRRGVALLMAVVALVVLGALATGFFFASLQEQRNASDALRRTRALAAAEDGLYRTLVPGVWSPLWSATPARGVVAIRVLNDDGVTDTVRVWKLTPSSFKLTSDAIVGAGVRRAERRVGLLVALRAPTLVPIAPATVREQATIGDAAIVNGTDTAFTTWNCPPTGMPLSAIAVPDSSDADASHCVDSSCLHGDPQVLVTTRAEADTTYERFRDVSRSELAAWGDEYPSLPTNIIPSPSITGDGDCGIVDPRNLGDPLRVFGTRSPCADYFPLRHAVGDVHFVGGAGQGLLIVDGDLTIDGDARFFGAAFVHGTVYLRGAAQFFGAVLARRVIMSGSAMIRLSRCALQRALHGAGVPIVPKGPTWAER